MHWNSVSAMRQTKFPALMELTVQGGRQGHMDKKRAGTGGVSEVARQSRGRYHQRKRGYFKQGGQKGLSEVTLKEGGA